MDTQEVKNGDILLLGASRVSTARMCDSCNENITDLRWKQCAKCKLYDLHCAVPGVQKECTAHNLNRYAQTVCQHTEMVPVEYNPEKTSQKDSEAIWRDYYKQFIVTRDKVKDDIDANIVLQGIQSEKVAQDDSLERSIEIVALKLLNYTVTPECRKMLCLDGGGVRGYFTILVLQTVIDQMFGTAEDNGENNNGFVPLDHPQWKFVRKFHVLGGTSTGGLIAFCLAVGYSLKALEELYTNFSYYFHRGVISTVTRIPFFFAKYDPERIDKRIEEIITNAWKNFAAYGCVDAEKKGSEVTLADYAKVTLRTEGRSIHTSQDAESKGVLPTLVITSYDITKNKVMLFNSAFQGTQQFKLLDILKATKAAPTYFPAVKIAIPHPEKTEADHNEHYFVDGGLFANDPSLATLFLQSLAVKNRTYAIVSIGTAAFPKTVNISPHGGYLSWLIPDILVPIQNWFRDKSEAVTDSTGLLVDTFMQANADLTETFLSNMNPMKVMRFKFNCNLPEAMALDDASFIEKVKRHFRQDGEPSYTDITKSKDMKYLVAFIQHYIVASRVSTEPGRGFLTHNSNFTKIVDKLIDQKVAQFHSEHIVSPGTNCDIIALKNTMGVHVDEQGEFLSSYTPQSESSSHRGKEKLPGSRLLPQAATKHTL